MNPLSAYGLSLGTVLSKLSANNFRFGFEQQFSQIQKTTVNRINSEIDRVNSDDDTPKRLAALEREYVRLEKNKALIDSFNFDMKSNQTRLARMETAAGEAIAAFSDEDGDTNLTATELATLTAKRDKLIKDTEGLLLSIHPDVATPYVVRDVKNMLDTLKSMSPVEGVVDAEGADPATNANRQILTDITTLKNLISTAYNVTTTAAENTTDISLDLSSTLATKLADMSEVSNVELQRREDEITAIKSKYGNILRVISLSFEARIDSLEKLGASLEGNQIDPGSVMNLFV